MREACGISTLDGRRLLFKHNNQIKVGCDVGRCVGEETKPVWSLWGRRLSVVWGDELNKKNRETGGLLAFDGRHLVGGHNNQITVDESGVCVNLVTGQRGEPFPILELTKARWTCPTPL